MNAHLKAYPSMIGLLFGTVFFFFSLTPSLVPRPFVLQGALSGLSFAIGYGFGTACLAAWRYLQLPQPGNKTGRRIAYLIAVVCLIFLLGGLWQGAYWQNSIRELMGMEELTGIQPLYIVPIAVLVFVVLLMLGRLFRVLFYLLAHWLEGHVPPRISRFLAISATVLVFWLVFNGMLLNFLLRTADRSFQQLDALIDPDVPVPIHAQQTGSRESLIDWRDLGRQGRSFVASGPTGEDLSDFFGFAVHRPIRVYVGLNSADDVQQRAHLALEELLRVGGFERSMLLLVTPTGTGWVDPAAQDTIEYLQHGDIATVAVQYSYLNSPLALLTKASYGVEMARALFKEIYGYWRSLPEDSRPRLYLHGMSLGSLNSDISFDFYDIIGQPFAGALWSGPPFAHRTWKNVTALRDAGSPSWLPTFRKGAVIRFMNQNGFPDGNTAEWGAFRILFLQYASDSITFFDPHYAWHRPDWMDEPRGPDVSPRLRWFPVVTMLQLAVDMMVGTAPLGFGHEIAPGDYLNAWYALTEPEGWSDAELDRLHSMFD
jgi:uncharacterized membrane protein